MAAGFDHARLHQRLVEAAECLGGKHEEYSIAVEQARTILIDEIGRIAEARRVAAKLRAMGEGDEPLSADVVRNLAYRMEEYVTQARGPWIGAPLFAPGWPDEEDT